jgi:hypothetical protein
MNISVCYSFFCGFMTEYFSNIILYNVMYTFYIYLHVAVAACYTLVILLGY